MGGGEGGVRRSGWRRKEECGSGRGRRSVGEGGGVWEGEEDYGSGRGRVSVGGGGVWEGEEEWWEGKGSGGRELSKQMPFSIMIQLLQCHQSV